MKPICLILALAFLLTGCTHGTVSTDPDCMTSDPTETAVYTDPSEGLLPDSASANTCSPVPQYTGTPLIEPDPHREFYVTLANQDCDFYPDTNFGSVNFYILSRQAYAGSQIQIKFNAQTNIQISIDDMTTYCRDTVHNGGAAYNLSEEQYMTMQGVDWYTLALAHQERQQAWDTLDRYNTAAAPIAAEEYDRLMGAINAYDMLWADNRSGYEELTPEDLPEFYCYAVVLTFQDYTDETIETMTLTLGEVRHTIAFGQWRFHAGLPEDYDPSSKYLNQEQSFSADHYVFDFQATPYNGGYIRLTDCISFQAQKDMTLTALRCTGLSGQVLGCRIRTQGSGAAGALDYYWDMHQPLDIAAGTQVSIDLILYSQEFASFSLGRTLMTTLDYTLNGQAFSADKYHHILRHEAPWDFYLMALGGYDLGAYYVCFLGPEADGWIQELPESWRK